MVKAHFAEILGQASALARKYIGVIYLNSIVLGLVMYLFNSVGLYLTILVGTLLASIGGEGILVAIVYIGILITILNLSQLTLAKLVSQHYTKEKFGLITCIGFSLKRTLRLMGYELMMFLLFIPILIFLGGFWEIFNLIPENDTLTTVFSHIINGDDLANITQSYILIPLLFRVGIFLSFTIIHSYWMFCSFGLPIIAAEDEGLIQTIKRSFLLIKYSFWEVFGSFILITLSAIGMMLGFQSISGVILAILSFVSEFTNLNIGIKLVFYLTSGFVLAITQIAGYIFIIAAMGIISVCIYYNQRCKYEGYDLELRLNDMIKNK